MKKALSAGWTLPETVERTPVWEEFWLSPTAPRAKLQPARYGYNVRKTFHSLAEGRESGRRIWP